MPRTVVTTVIVVVCALAALAEVGSLCYIHQGRDTSFMLWLTAPSIALALLAAAARNRPMSRARLVVAVLVIGLPGVLFAASAVKFLRGGPAEDPALHDSPMVEMLLPVLQWFFVAPLVLATLFARRPRPEASDGPHART